MKIALIIPANRCYSPYLDIYIDILDKINISYDVIYLNRMNLQEDGIAYNIRNIKNSHKLGLINSLITYYKYSKFVKKQIRINKYEKVIIFSSQLAIFLSSFLRENMKNCYALDFRDISIEQKLPFLYQKVVLGAEYVSISSKGFIPHLPKFEKYVISHNFKLWDRIKEQQTVNDLRTKNKIKILTIGAIRDFSSNQRIINAFANSKRYELLFIGSGPASDLLKIYCESHGIANVVFRGYYKKEEEGAIVKGADIMNIYYPDSKLHNTSLSNRFYNALFYRLPMIVSTNSYHSEYIRKFNLGIEISPKDNIEQEVENLVNNFSSTDFNRSSINLLTSFIADYNKFEHAVVNFINRTCHYSKIKHF